MENYGYTHDETDLIKFVRDKSYRALEQSEFALQIDKARKKYLIPIQELERNGISTIKGFFNHLTLSDIKESIAHQINNRRNLSRIRNLAEESESDLKSGIHKYYSEDDINSPDFCLDQKVNVVSIRDPLINIPTLLDVVLSDDILNIATAYFQVLPLLTFVKVYHSFVNQLPAMNTQLFHADGGSFRIFKTLIYLNDVEENGGPFTYVKGSHLQKPDNWHTENRFTEDYMYKYYGSDSIVKCIASYGDLLIAETTGFHCGYKPTTKPRTIIILNFAVHSEYGYEYPKPKILHSEFDKLDTRQRIVASNLNLV